MFIEVLYLLGILGNLRFTKGTLANFFKNKRESQSPHCANLIMKNSCLFSGGAFLFVSKLLYFYMGLSSSKRGRLLAQGCFCKQSSIDFDDNKVSKFLRTLDFTIINPFS